MATIVNNPGPNQDSGGGAGWAVAVVVLLLVILIGYFGISHFGGRSAGPSANVNVSLPSGGGSAGGSGGATQ